MTNLIDPNSIPEYLRQAYEDSAVSNLLGGGPSIDRISIRGRVWRLYEGGQEVGANPAPSLQVVLVAAAPKVSRAYYEGDFDADTKSGPLCWSGDGDVPDAKAKQKQAPNCAQCPMNIAGSGKNDSRACRFHQRIAVALPDRLNKVYAMTIPATSLWGDKVQPGMPAPLTQYAAFLASQRLPMEGVTTEMSFDINQTQPTIRFRAAGWLNQQQFGAVKQLAQSQEAQDAVLFNVASREVAALPPAQVPQMIAAPVTATVIPVQTQQSAVIIPTFGAAPVNAQQPVPTTFVQPPAPAQQAVPAGFGGFAEPATQGGFAPTTQPAKKAGTRRKADPQGQPEIPAGFGGQPTAPAGFAHADIEAHPPAGFGGFQQPTEQPTAPAGFADPVVISPNDVAAQTGTDAASIEALLNTWATKQ